MKQKFWYDAWPPSHVGQIQALASDFFSDGIVIGTGGKEVATSDILLDVEAVVPLVTVLVESAKAAMKKEMIIY